MIDLKHIDKEERYQLVRGCEPFYITYRSPRWQQPVVTKLKKEFGNKYEIPIKVVLTAASKAVRYNLTGSQFPLDFMKFKKTESRTKKNIPYKLMKDLITLMEDSGYLTLLKGYNKYNNERGITTCLRFHDKLLKHLDKNYCNRWGISRLENFNCLEVVDSTKSTKTNKVFHSLKKFKGVADIRGDINLVNKVTENHLITYKGDTCAVLYKRRFEDDLQSGGRWYVAGTFQIENSEGRSTIKIDQQPTIEADISSIHPSLMASLIGLVLPSDYDPYNINDYVKVGISDKSLRDFIKPCFMALLYGSNRATALHEIREKLWRRKEIADWLDAETILEALEDRNYMFKDFFYKKDNWKLFQYMDARLSAKVMIHFAKKNKVCLGYHDSWVVKQEDKEELLDLIQQSWKEIVGNNDNLRIEIKHNKRFSKKVRHH